MAPRFELWRQIASDRRTPSTGGRNCRSDCQRLASGQAIPPIVPIAMIRRRDCLNRRYHPWHYPRPIGTRRQGLTRGPRVLCTGNLCRRSCCRRSYGRGVRVYPIVVVRRVDHCRIKRLSTSWSSSIGPKGRGNGVPFKHRPRLGIKRAFGNSLSFTRTFSRACRPR